MNYLGTAGPCTQFLLQIATGNDINFILSAVFFAFHSVFMRLKTTYMYLYSISCTGYCWKALKVKGLDIRDYIHSK